MFGSPLDSHYSQTYFTTPLTAYGLGALWIRTTLKQEVYSHIQNLRLGALWIRTTLKLPLVVHFQTRSLGALWIRTTLKRQR